MAELTLKGRYEHDEAYVYAFAFGNRAFTIRVSRVHGDNADREAWAQAEWAARTLEACRGQ